MYKNVAFIPARGGSKSIPLKNIKNIAGKPLIRWVIDAAVNSEIIDKVYVSTDSDKIRKLVENFKIDNVEIISRSAESATDTASTESVMLEFANRFEFENIILLQATSPLTSAEDVENAFALFSNNKADGLLSVVRQKRFIWKEGNSNTVAPYNYDYLKRPRRQDFDGYLVENGAIYITSKKNLLKSFSRISGKIIPYEMSEDTYYELDEPSDWNIVENLLLNKKKFKDNSFFKRLSNIKLIATDVDGVLTDTGMYYSENGDELKKFSTRDGKAFELFRNQGILTAIITSENTQMVERRAKKLKIDYLYQGINDKLTTIKELALKAKVRLDEIVYIGDDLNDISVLKNAGVSFAPLDAVLENKRIVNYICTKKGGAGCIREIFDLYAQSKNIIIE